MSPEPRQHGSCVNKCHITSGSGMNTETEPELSAYHRQILAHLRTHGGTMSSVQLAKGLADNRAKSANTRFAGEWVECTPTSEGNTLRTVYIELLERHLPVLEEQNLISYCDQNGIVSLTTALS